MTSASGTRPRLVIGAVCAAALLIGLGAGYGVRTIQANSREASLTAEIEKTSEAEAALATELEDLRTEAADLRERYDAESEQVSTLEAQVASMTDSTRGEATDPDGLALAAMAAIGEPDVVNSAELSGGVVRIYTNITDPRGPDGSPEAQHAIRICELAAGAVGDVGVAVYESDDSTFVTGAPCTEH